MCKIQKKIHYCWFGNGEKSKVVKECIKSWNKILKGYEIIEWNEKNFDIEMSNFTKQAYKAKKWAFVSDYCRLWVLYKYGGIYLDTDMEILKDISVFLNNKSFAGTEDGELISFGIWGCKAGDKFIKQILDYYDNVNFNDYRDNLFELAIPKIVTELAKENGYIPSKELIYFFDEIAIYPKEVFYPKNHSWEDAIITNETYTIHHYEGSWRSKKQIMRSKLKKIIINLYKKIK